MDCTFSPGPGTIVEWARRPNNPRHRYVYVGEYGIPLWLAFDLVAYKHYWSKWRELAKGVEAGADN
jgi:hypothetical protein